MSVPKKSLIIFVIFQLLLHLKAIYCEKNYIPKGNAISEVELFKSPSILFGFISIIMNNETDLTSKCILEMKDTREGLIARQSWAMKMLDSSGKPSPGFMMGNNFWLGSPQECKHVTEELKLSLSARYERRMKPDLLISLSPFDVQFRIIHAKHHSPWQVEMKVLSENILHVGVCLPKSCSNAEVHLMAQRYFHKGNGESSLLEFDPEILQIKDLEVDEKFWQKKSVLILCSSCLMIALLSRLSKTNYFANSSQLSRFINCFSYKRNLLKFKTMNEGPDTIPVMNGIKSISCYLILIVHFYWYSFNTMSKPTDLFPTSTSFFVQIFANSSIMVDAFFTISGFLVVHNFLKNQARIATIQKNSFWENFKLFGKLSLHRYIRLTPVHLIVLLLNEITASYLHQTSLFWVYPRYDLSCSKNWWQNFLYIQNLFNHEDICVSWTWSLCCDMQYFLIATILLFIYARNKNLGIKLTILLSTVLTLISLFLNIYHKFELSYDVLFQKGTELYTAPWTRMCPYIVGGIAAWYLSQNDNKVKLSKETVNTLWIATAFMFIKCVHAKSFIPHHVIQSFLRVIYHIEIGLITAWVIVADVSGYHNFTTKFLSSRKFKSISKISYALYLVGPTISIFLFGISERGLEMDLSINILVTYGLIYASEKISFLLTIYFEIPFYNLSKEFLQENSAKKVN